MLLKFRLSFHLAEAKIQHRSIMERLFVQEFGMEITALSVPFQREVQGLFGFFPFLVKFAEVRTTWGT